MRDLLILLVHLITTTARLMGRSLGDRRVAPRQAPAPDPESLPAPRGFGA